MKRIAAALTIAAGSMALPSQAAVSQPSPVRCIAVDLVAMSCGYVANGIATYVAARQGPWKIEIDYADPLKPTLIFGMSGPYTGTLVTTAGDKVRITLLESGTCPNVGPPVGTAPVCAGGPVFAVERS